jgi:hypothetical protein
MQGWAIRGPGTRARLIGRLIVAVALAATVLVVRSPDPAGAVAPGRVVLASHTPVGPTTAPVGASFAPVMSAANGSYVAYMSTGTNLVSGQSDGNGGADIFLYERSTGAVTLVSHAAGSATTTGNGVSSLPSISADGAYVAFESTADNLVSGAFDPKGSAGSDVFLWNRATNTTSLVSHSTAGALTAGNDSAHNPSISADGAFVAFDSFATTLVSGTDPVSTNDVFLYSRASGTVSLVSHTAASLTTAAANESSFASISADGNWVVFVSRGTNLVPAQSDSANSYDYFLYSRATGALTLVSHVPASASTTGNGNLRFLSSISADGGSVAFESTATNLVAGQSDANGDSDVFVWSRATGAVMLASRGTAGLATTGNNVSQVPKISADGTWVAFTSRATNLSHLQTDVNGDWDAFRYHNGEPFTVSVVSYTPGTLGNTGNGPSEAAAISADGGYISVASLATNLVPGQTDTNGAYDAFLYPLAGSTAKLMSHIWFSATTTANAQSLGTSMSANGAVVALSSLASNLALGQSDANGASDVFVYSWTADTRRGPADFDGDGDTDISVFRPSNGYWFVQGGATTQFGTNGDIPVPGNYDGDDDTDVAVFRPSTGVWFVRGGATTAWGSSGDIPVPGDYDGDGDTDIAVFRPASGVWFMQDGLTVAWGANGDIPVPGDYDGDGDTDIAVFRPSNGIWFVQGGVTTAWGTNGDIPVPADYGGDGKTDIVVFRPSIGTWFFAGPGGGFAQPFGTAGDLPQPGDYDADGRNEIAVFRPSTGTWFLYQSGSSAAFGVSTDIPLPLPDAIRRFFA